MSIRCGRIMHILQAPGLLVIIYNYAHYLQDTQSACGWLRILRNRIRLYFVLTGDV